MFKTTEKRKSLTFIELLLVALTLVVLSVILIPQIAHSAQKAKQADCDTNIDTINSAIETYNADNGAYPATLADVIGTNRAPTVYFPDSVPQCPLGGTYIIDADCRATCSHKFAW